MQRILIILASSLFFDPFAASAANPPNSPDIVFIDGQPCNRACQSYMAWSRKLIPATAQPERLSATPATGAARRVTGIREQASRPRAEGRAIRHAAASDIAEAKIQASPPPGVPAAPTAKAIDARPTAGVATDSGKTLQQVTAATAAAERLTTDPTVAIVIARPDIKSVSDLAHKTIAFDESQFALSGNTRTAIVAAGATGVQLSESQTRPIDRMIRGEVPAAVLTLASRKAADGFPDVKGFNIFRISLTSEEPQEEIGDRRPAEPVVSSSREKTTQELVTAATATAERMTDGAASQAAPLDARTAILIARPDIKSVSDLAHRTVAFDERQSALRSDARSAIVAAGAQGVQLSESQTRPIDRVVGGEVPAAVLTLVSREAADGFPDVKGFNVFRIPLASKETQAKIADPRPAEPVASSSREKTTQELVTAATAMAERMTDGTAASQVVPLDARIAILIARPDIKSVSDLTGKDIALDDKLPGSSRKIQIAMTAAGATDVRLNERQAKASERVIDGAVPAAILTLVSREAADAFPEVPGFKIFRIPCTPEKVVDLHPTTQAFAAQLDPRATRLTDAKQTTVAVAGDVPKAKSGDSSGNVARLMARASSLLAQGNIIAARDVLGRAAETGNARASFTLAETYDPLILPKWGVYGTRGDPTKARELYAKAEAGGIEEAKARFEALASSAH